jgi:environmental stress-induced protein Ves
MRRLDPVTYRAMPWKNGGGTTTEVLTLPEGAGIETFEARVSLARVEADGDFSLFPGVDRTLVVTEGAGVSLLTADGGTVDLDPLSTPFAFTGDDPVHATLKRGPIADFNVMTRRAAHSHRVMRVVVDGDRSVVCAGELTLLAVLSGTVVADDGGTEVTLGPGEIVAIAPDEPFVVVAVEALASLPGRPGAAPAPELLVVDFFRR